MAMAVTATVGTAARRPAAPARTATQARTGTHLRTTTRVRLTRRGRLTIFLTVLVVAMVAVFGHAAASADAPAAPTPVTVHVVVSGDTLWDVARTVTPAGQDVRDTIVKIDELNDLTGSRLTVGQQLLLPRG